MTFTSSETSHLPRAGFHHDFQRATMFLPVGRDHDTFVAWVAKTIVGHHTPSYATMQETNGSAILCPILSACYAHASRSLQTSHFYHKYGSVVATKDVKEKRHAIRDMRYIDFSCVSVGDAHRCVNDATKPTTADCISIFPIKNTNRIGLYTRPAWISASIRTVQGVSFRNASYRRRSLVRIVCCIPWPDHASCCQWA